MSSHYVVVGVRLESLGTTVQSSAVVLWVHRWVLVGVPVLPGEVGLRTVLTLNTVSLTLSSDDEISS